MTVLELYEACGRVGDLHCPSNRPVTGISRHTEHVSEGDIFFCRQGKIFDSHAVATELFSAGAAVVVGHQELSFDGNYWRVDKGDEAKIAAAFYGHPSRRLKILGITGTDGKSTTAWITAQLLKANGFSTACLGTLGIWKGEGWQPWGFTTPEPEVLQKTFADLVTEGFTHVVMEVSSHSLSSARVRGTQFTSVALTNLGRDHLDDYVSLEEYHAAKEMLFALQKHPHFQVRPLSSPGVAYWQTGKNPKVTLIEAARNVQKIVIENEGKSWDCDFSLGGQHNLENLATSLGLLSTLAVDFDFLKNTLAHIKPLAGRWQWVENTKQQVMVDYAHTPGALKTLLSNVRPLVKGELKVLFGCGGNRDSEKRFLMGQEAHKLADIVYVTDDNPRDEDPDSIRAEILRGAKGEGVNIADRHQAIETAINELNTDDILVIAGKGHESGQVIKNEIKEFNDVTVVRKLWKQRHVG